MQKQQCHQSEYTSTSMANQMECCRVCLMLQTRHLEAAPLYNTTMTCGKMEWGGTIIVSKFNKHLSHEAALLHEYGHSVWQNAMECGRGCLMLQSRHLSQEAAPLSEYCHPVRHNGVGGAITLSRFNRSTFLKEQLYYMSMAIPCGKMQWSAVEVI